MTVTELVARVRDVANLAIRADTTDQKIIDESNSELSTRLVPLFRKMRGGFFRDYVDYPIVANQKAYAIPERAVESGIEQVKYLDSDGNEIIDLKEINTRQIGRLSPQWWLVSDTTATTPSSFYFDQGNINLSPVVSVAVGSLRVYYQRRPGTLVLAASVGVIGTVAQHVLTVPATPAGITDGLLIDVMGAKSPFKLLAKDAIADSHTSTTITSNLTDFVAGGVRVGDHVMLASQAFVPEIPQEWHEILVDLTVAKMHYKVGNIRAEAGVRESAAEKLKLLIASTTPRGSNVPRVVFPSW